jgi:enoyl-CoA hydratase/carnithine racemase
VLTWQTRTRGRRSPAQTSASARLDRLAKTRAAIIAAAKGSGVAGGMSILVARDLVVASNRRVEQLTSKRAIALALGRKGYYALAPMVPCARVDYAQTLLPVLLAAAKGALVPR